MHLQRPYMNGHGEVPKGCAYCGHGFWVVDHGLKAIRGPEGKLFCSEDCRDAYGESLPLNRRAS